MLWPAQATRSAAREGSKAQELVPENAYPWFSSCPERAQALQQGERKVEQEAGLPEEGLPEEGLLEAEDWQGLELGEERGEQAQEGVKGAVREVARLAGWAVAKLVWQPVGWEESWWAVGWRLED